MFRTDGGISVSDPSKFGSDEGSLKIEYGIYFWTKNTIGRISQRAGQILVILFKIKSFALELFKRVWDTTYPEMIKNRLTPTHPKFQSGPSTKEP